MTTAALIPAAGNGLRLGEGPKALLRLGDRTLLEILVDKLQPLVDQVIVAAPDAYLDHFAQLVGNARVKVIAGGGLRRDTVEKMLHATDAETVLIQNVASPFASPALLQAVLQAAVKSGAAGAFFNPCVPVARVDQGQLIGYWERTEAAYFQTPQAFNRDLLLQSHHLAGVTHYQSTIQYVIEAGFAVTAIVGEEENFKITSELDWQIAKQIIAPRLGL